MAVGFAVATRVIESPSGIMSSGFCGVTDPDPPVGVVVTGGETEVTLVPPC